MPDPPRRTFLRTAAGLAAGTVLTGCNETAGDGTTDPDTETRDPSPTAAGTALATPTLTPTLTATPLPSPTPTETPSPTPTSSPTSTPQQGALARTFVRDLAAGEYESAHEALAPTAANQLSPNALHRYWLGLTAQHGAFREVGSVERSTESGYVVARVTAVCADAAQVVRCVFDDRDRIAGLQFPTVYSPPAYADESAFTEESVTVEATDCALPGTLTRPEDTDAAPGVVLVHGSGPNDRDETIGPNKPFRDLAWGLASRGVAVLRYDKRNYACRVAPADWDVDTLVVDDAVTAFDLLGERDGVDADRRFVVGHSLGAVCTPRIADRLADVAGGAMLAASARPITDVVRDQYRHILSVDGELSDDDEAQLASVDEDIERIENGDVDPGETVLDLPGAWWTSLLDCDQVGTARDVDLPLWLAQGGRDYQVSAEDDFELWRDELSDRSDTRFDLYPDLSHLFQAGSEPSIGTEYNFQDNVAESVVADLADWIAATG